MRFGWQSWLCRWSMAILWPYERDWLRSLKLMDLSKRQLRSPGHDLAPYLLAGVPVPVRSSTPPVMPAGLQPAWTVLTHAQVPWSHHHVLSPLVICSIIQLDLVDKALQLKSPGHSIHLPASQPVSVPWSYAPIYHQPEWSKPLSSSPPLMQPGSQPVSIFD